MATGELRATMALTEPGGGSDLQAMRTTARREGDRYVVNGGKTWITNAQRADLIALHCKTDPDARPAHSGISILLAEKGSGLTVGDPLPKLGYKGVESCELFFEDFVAPANALLGGTEGRGFAQMMKGLEIVWIQVASRALGVAQAAFDDAPAYAQLREAFGKPIWQHQSVGNYLADMATMITLNAIRIHGGHGYSTDIDVERYFRDAPLMIVGEGTNEIQRNVIVRQLIRRGGIDQPCAGLGC
jgi:alkylation response protein AidB-like acyl-CoA dehydrogenase